MELLTFLGKIRGINIIVGVKFLCTRPRFARESAVFVSDMVFINGLFMFKSYEYPLSLHPAGYFDGQFTHLTVRICREQ